LDQALVGVTKSMLRESTFTSKNPPSTSINEKFVGYSTSIGHSTFFNFFVALLSTYFSSS
jgi:hypothetical protein